MLFENMNLNVKLLQAIKNQKFETPTEIQKRAIPPILRGEDVLATAQTGSGKTLAYAIPILELLNKEPLNKEGRGPRVVVLSPTRELANQIIDSTKSLARDLPYKFGVITGGVPYFNQEKLLRGKVDVLIATPGRLMDHMEQERVDFSRVELFILDEADRMLDMGFRKDVEYILSAVPEKRQILLFSATFENELRTVANRFLKNPTRIELGLNQKPHALISQRIYQTMDHHHKNALLQHILEESGMWQAIVFVRTKRGAEKLAEDLSNQRYHCAALHGDMKQGKRTRTLERLHRGELKALIATDVAARGLDVKRLSHVINYDLPANVDDYVHRIGRTGRCGETGTAISFVGPADWSTISQIERHTGQRLERQTIPGLEPKGNPREHSQSQRTQRPRFKSDKPAFRGKSSGSGSSFSSGSGSGSGAGSSSRRSFGSGAGSSSGRRSGAGESSGRNARSHSAAGSGDFSRGNSRSSSGTGPRQNFGSRPGASSRPGSDARGGFGARTDSAARADSGARASSNPRTGSGEGRWKDQKGKAKPKFNPAKSNTSGPAKFNRFRNKEETIALRD